MHILILFNEYIVSVLYRLLQCICSFLYPVASPLSSIKCGITLHWCFVYFLQFVLSTVCQNCSVPLTSSSFVCGLTSQSKYSFNSCHKFLIGFRSGDSRGCLPPLNVSGVKEVVYVTWCALGVVVLHQFLSIRVNFSNEWYTIIGSSMHPYSATFIFALNMQILVAPLKQIPAHMCTFIGCFGLCGCSHNKQVITICQ